MALTLHNETTGDDPMRTTKQGIDDDNDDDTFDAAGLLKDGRTWRVPFKAMDSFQRDVARHFADADADADAKRRTAKHRIYDEYDAAIAEEFKKPSTGVGSHGFIGALAGDLCTVRAGGGRYGPEGSAGHLRLINGELLCIADGFRADSHARDVNKTKESAYSAYDAEVANAWKQR